MNETCPLCLNTQTSLHFVANGRTFFECSDCRLLFVAKQHFLSFDQQKQRYDQHRNSTTDPKYREHLARLRDTLQVHLSAGMQGLDYGCGPTTLLAELFAENGFVVDNYDPIYGPPKPASLKQYDFITCSETAEHFQDPHREFSFMTNLLRPGGWIAIMTGLRDCHLNDPSWWYLRDSTHVCFYSKATFEKMRSLFSWNLVSLAHNIVVLRL